MLLSRARLLTCRVVFVAMRCHQCGSSDVDVDPSRSDVVCMECGAVLSDVSIVSEVNFSEQPSGLSSVVGQFVSLSGSRGLSSSAKRGVGVGGVSSAGYGRDSREQTLSVGRKLLQQLSDALRLRAIHVDQAYGHFKLAVQHNFIQGRRTRYVAAACMYVACRKSKTPHLLLDLADALQVNLYMLGATLLKLVRTLHIALPIVDPSLYIHRFAAQLQLQPSQSLPTAASASSSHLKDHPAAATRGAASTTHMVAMTALRLVSRMKRDWLQVGRRPSGICGACLLIACRMHGYRRSHREILDVVRVCATPRCGGDWWSSSPRPAARSRSWSSSSTWRRTRAWSLQRLWTTATTRRPSRALCKARRRRTGLHDVSRRWRLSWRPRA